MAKLLNIDELTQQELAIKIGGVEYSVVERSVQQVLTAIKAEKELKDADEATKLEKFVQMLNESIPDCPKEKLLRLPMATLNQIFEFISDTETVQSETQDGEQGKQ